VHVPAALTQFQKHRDGSLRADAMLNLYRRRGFLPLGHALQADVDEGYPQIFGLAERTQERSVSHRRCDRDSGSPRATELRS
jgi:hypothetical protein